MSKQADLDIILALLSKKKVAIGQVTALTFEVVNCTPSAPDGQIGLIV